MTSETQQVQAMNTSLLTNLTDIGMLDSEKQQTKNLQKYMSEEVAERHEEITKEIDLILKVFLHYIDYEKFFPYGEL